MNEAGALRAMQNGSEEALGWIIDRYSAYVHTVVCNILGGYMPQADMEEVDSDVFLALWNHAEKLRPSSLKAWLGCVARNAAKNKLRSMGKELPLEDDMILISPDSTDERMLSEERKALVRQAVLDMVWPDREIFLRHYFYAQPVGEIASQLSMNPDTVKTRLRRGREKLRAILEKAL